MLEESECLPSSAAVVPYPFREVLVEVRFMGNGGYVLNSTARLFII